MEDKKVKNILRDAISKWGTKRELARQMGVSENHLYRMLADVGHNIEAKPISLDDVARILDIVAPGSDHYVALLREAGVDV